MARILFTWELGRGLHHLANIERLARILAADGHELAVALRELHSAPRLLSDLKLQYYQAPHSTGPPPREVLRYGAYSHLLYASGFGDPQLLQVLVSAWVGILASYRPDLVVFDHSPTALLASRGFDARRVVVGSGFCVPPPAQALGVLPDFDPSVGEREQLLADEELVLAVANQAANGFRMQPLSRLADLYAQAEQSFVLGFPELDPFAPRESSNYLGVDMGSGREAVAWPEGGSPRVLVYASAFPGLGPLLDVLHSRNATVLVYSGNLPPGLVARLSASGAHFRSGLMNLPRLAEDCDLFVSHGSHTSVTQTLLAGVPQLVIPYFREQELTARSIVRLGAGQHLRWPGEDVARSVEALLGEASYREAAQRFARSHESFDLVREGERFGARVRAILDA